jgi:hypothetical protein
MYFPGSFLPRNTRRESKTFTKAIWIYRCYCSLLRWQKRRTSRPYPVANLADTPNPPASLPEAKEKVIQLEHALEARRIQQQTHEIDQSAKEEWVRERHNARYKSGENAISAVWWRKFPVSWLPKHVPRLGSC